MLYQKICLCDNRKNLRGSQVPFKSVAQKNFLYSQEPEVAKEFAAHTSKKAYKKLPEHVEKRKPFKAFSNKIQRKKNV
jgi:hypothetical protein